MPSLDPITRLLVDRLDYELRRQVLSRRENMLRELRFLEENDDSRLAIVRRAGWRKKELAALCGLNSFYQLVLGPLASSARDRHGILGREVPILYGDSLRFDEHRSSELRGAHAAFMAALSDVPKARRVVTAPHLSDLVYRLARAIEEQGYE